MQEQDLEIERDCEVSFFCSPDRVSIEFQSENGRWFNFRTDIATAEQFVQRVQLIIKKAKQLTAKEARKNAIN